MVIVRCREQSRGYFFVRLLLLILRPGIGDQNANYIIAPIDLVLSKERRVCGGAGAENSRPQQCIAWGDDQKINARE